MSTVFTALTAERLDSAVGRFYIDKKHEIWYHEYALAVTKDSATVDDRLVNMSASLNTSTVPN